MKKKTTLTLFIAFSFNTYASVGLNYQDCEQILLNKNKDMITSSVKLQILKKSGA
jgi:hypothetical protein